MSETSRPSSEAFSPTVAGRVDQVCNRFELAWRGPSRARIEDFVDAAPEPERSALLRELILLEVEYRRGRGEDCRAEEYQGRFPLLDAAWLAGAVASRATVGSDDALAAT